MSRFAALAPAITERPSHWDVSEFRRVYRPVEKPRGERKLALLSLSARAGELAAREPDAKQQPTDEYLKRYWEVAPGDLVVNPMWLIGGSIGVSKIGGAVSPDYRVYRSERVAPRFGHHLLRSQGYFEQYKLLVRAETTFDRRITKQDFNQLPVLLPPLDEQCAIADYLDAETARVDALIAKKQQLVGRVDERRRGFISRAVSQGLNDGALVPTGDPFVPLLPREWRLLRMRHVVEQIVDTPHATAPVVEASQFLVVRTANVKMGALTYNDARYTDEESWKEWSRRGCPRPGDVLFTREAPAGEACVVPDHQKLCLGQRMVLLQIDQSVTSGEWIVHAIYAGGAQRFIEVFANATTVAHLNMSDIRDIPVSIPPIAEQRRILTEIRQTLDACQAVEARLTHQIELLREHRQALITAAVTGEFRVPGAA